MMLCSEGSCSNKSYARGSCRSHYYKADRLKDPEKTRLRDKICNSQRTNKGQWLKDHPEVRRLHQSKRKAKLRGSEATLTLEEWNKILEDFNYLCFWCGSPWEVVDHFQPLSRGGTHSANNVVPACGPCNQLKYNKDPLEFMVVVWNNCNYLSQKLGVNPAGLILRRSAPQPRN